MSARFAPREWTPMSTRFFRDPKVLEAGRDAALLYLAGLCYCQEHLTDGVIPKAAARIIAAEAFTTTKAANALVKAGMWEDEGESYIVHGWLEWNRSAEEVEAQRRAANDRKRAWREAKDKKRTGRPAGSGRDTSRDAGHDQDATQDTTRLSRSTPDLTPDLPPYPRGTTDAERPPPPDGDGAPPEEEGTREHREDTPPAARSARPPWLPATIPSPDYWPGEYDPAQHHPEHPNAQPLAWTVTADLVDGRDRSTKATAIAEHLAASELDRALAGGATISNRNAWLAAATRTAAASHDIDGILDRYPWAEPARLAGLLDERTGHPDGRSLHTCLGQTGSEIHATHVAAQTAHIAAAKAADPDIAKRATAKAKAALNGGGRKEAVA